MFYVVCDATCNAMNDERREIEIERRCGAKNLSSRGQTAKRYPTAFYFIRYCRSIRTSLLFLSTLLCQQRSVCFSD